MDIEERLKDLYLQGKTYKQIAKALSMGENQVKCRIRRREYYIPRSSTNGLQEALGPTSGGMAVKSSRVINQDGSQEITRAPIYLNEEQLASPAMMLIAHGLDPEAWELIRGISNLWPQQLEGGTQIQAYQTKLIIKPRVDNWAEILDQIRKNTTALEVFPEPEEITNRYLVVGCNDLHFGHATLEDYLDSQQRIINIIDNRYEAVVIALIGDLLDTNDLRGKTAHGTQLDPIDMPRAWADLCSYIEPMIIHALKTAKVVHIMFARGNHSEAMEFAFIQYLKSRFPQAVTHDSLKYSKAIRLGQNAIGFSHGYKRPKNLKENLPKLYPDVYEGSEYQEIIVGHKHVDNQTDGTIIRTLPTRAPLGEWEDEENFLITNPAFLCIEYGPNYPSAMYYV